MKIIEGLKKIYSGHDAFTRHLSLFSICGIAGLVDVYVTTEGLNSLNLISLIFYMLFGLIFALFITGYEIIFLRERELPDIDFRAFKLLLNKPLMLVAFITTFLVFGKLFPQFAQMLLLFELILAVPMTLIQGGFSYNYDENEAFSLFTKLSVKNYFILFLKRFGLIILSYLIISLIIFVIFFVLGICIVIAHHSDMQAIGLSISSMQFAVSKLSNFISGTLLVYILSISTLVWDYELIKTFED